MTTTLSGVFSPSITITNSQGEIDEMLWGVHLENLIQAGISGILVFGSIGEFFAFTYEQKKSAISFAVESVNGRVPLFVGVGGTNMKEVVGLSKYAEKAGAYGVCAVSPYYFGPSNDAAKRYFNLIASAVDIPILMYNFPDRTGSDLSPDLIAHVASRHPHVVGVKDTVDTISHTRKIITKVAEVRDDFAVFSGFDEYYIPNRICGGAGVISGLTNVDPQLFVRLHSAYESGDYATAVSCTKEVSRLMALYDMSDLFISAIKAGVKAKGLPIVTDIGEPAVPISNSAFKAIQNLLNR